MVRGIGRRLVAVGGLILASPAFAAPTQTVSGNADHGVIAGTINGNVTVGYTADQMRRALAARSDKALADKAQELGVALGAFNAFFVIVGERNVPHDQYEAKLIEYAGRYRNPPKAIAALPPSASPEVASLKAQAEAAATAFKFDEADRLLAQIEAAQDAALRSQLAERSATATSRAEIAMTQFRYRDAALHFAEAARRAPDDQTKLAALDAEADADYRQGDEFGDNDALASAILRYGILIELRPRDRFPLDWAATQGRLGIALGTLGARESGTASLEKAVEAYSAALLEYTRDRAPLEWARTQVDLGNTLVALSARESGTASLEKAVDAYSAALLEETRDRVPQLWASAELNLGNALAAIGARESDTASLEKAVAAYSAALLEETRDRAPLQWASAEMNLGSALAQIGVRESGTSNLQKAVEVLSAALMENTRDRVPLAWAMTQASLGNALVALGERESGTASLEKAVVAFSAALLENTRDRVPLDWARTEADLGSALAVIGERESGVASLEKAATAYSAALSEEPRDRAPLLWASAEMSLGYVRFLIATRRNDIASLQAIGEQVTEARLVALQNGDQRDAAFADAVLGKIAAAKGRPRA